MEVRGRTINMRRHARVEPGEVNKERTFLERKKVTILRKNPREGGGRVHSKNLMRQSSYSIHSVP